MSLPNARLNPKTAQSTEMIPMQMKLNIITASTPLGRTMPP